MGVTLVVAALLGIAVLQLARGAPPPPEPSVPVPQAEPTAQTEPTPPVA
jgi:hypothetical protein